MDQSGILCDVVQLGGCELQRLRQAMSLLRGSRTKHIPKMLEGTKHHAWMHDATVLVKSFGITNDTTHGIEMRHFYLVFISVVKVFRFLDGLISLMLSSHMMRALRAAEKDLLLLNRFS